MRWRRCRNDGTSSLVQANLSHLFADSAAVALASSVRATVQLVERVLRRPVTGHVTKQIGLQKRLPDIRRALAVARRDERDLGDYLAALEHRESFALRHK
jgi:hypothetical protein